MARVQGYGRHQGLIQPVHASTALKTAAVRRQKPACHAATNLFADNVGGESLLRCLPIIIMVVFQLNFNYLSDQKKAFAIFMLAQSPLNQVSCFRPSPPACSFKPFGVLKSIQF